MEEDLTNGPADKHASHCATLNSFLIVVSVTFIFVVVDIFREMYFLSPAQNCTDNHFIYKQNTCTMAINSRFKDFLLGILLGLSVTILFVAKNVMDDITFLPPQVGLLLFIANSTFGIKTNTVSLTLLNHVYTPLCFISASLNFSLFQSLLHLMFFISPSFNHCNEICFVSPCSNIYYIKWTPLLPPADFNIFLHKCFVSLFPISDILNVPQLCQLQSLLNNSFKALISHYKFQQSRHK